MQNDRIPTLTEVRKIVEYPDRRIKPIVYTIEIVLIANIPRTITNISVEQVHLKVSLLVQ